MNKKALKCIENEDYIHVLSEERLKIGIMGGSFDPIHNGHLVAGSEVQRRFSLDKVFFTPSKNSPEKKLVASPENRYEMVVIATASNPIFSASRVDIDRQVDITYTIDTIADFKKLYPNADLYFISGLDSISRVDKWQNYELLKKEVKFIAVTRPGYSNSELKKLDCDFTILEIPGLDISSTDCRKRVEESRPIWYLVPDGVVQYIQKEGIYSYKNTLKLV